MSVAVILMLLLAPVVATFSLYVNGVRDQVEKMAPEYAKQLYFGTANGFNRGVPISVSLLFLLRPPEVVRDEIRIMRAICAGAIALLIALVASLAL